MKKAKIFVSAFAVLALVGGTLAFSAKKYSGTVYCTSATGQTAGQAGCPAFSPSTYNTGGTGSFCTITNGNACDVTAGAPARN